MTVWVDKNRFLGVACGAGETIVFDKDEEKYHLLRGSAAGIWEKIGEGGSFPIIELLPEPDGDCSAALEALAQAQLIRFENGSEETAMDPTVGRADRGAFNRREWLGLTGRAAATATLIPLVISLVAPTKVLAQGRGHGLGHGGGHSSVSSVSTISTLRNGASPFAVEKGNNGVGNGCDPQPPGDPPINDGEGTGPGNPGNRGGPPFTGVQCEGIDD